KRSSSRSVIAWTSRTGRRTVASSMARGLPSSRRHSPATSAWLSDVTSNPATTAPARSANSRAAPEAGPGSGLMRLGVWGRARGGWGGKRKGGARKTDLPGYAQRLATRGQDTKPGAAAEQRLDQHRRRREQVLAVVHHQEETPFRQVLSQDSNRPAGGPVAQTQSHEDGVRDERRTLAIGQLDGPDSIRKSSDQVGRHPQSQACLASASRPGEGQQPGRLQKPLDLCHLVPAPDKAVQLGRKVVRPARGSAVP